MPSFDQCRGRFIPTRLQPGRDLIRQNHKSVRNGCQAFIPPEVSDAARCADLWQHGLHYKAVEGADFGERRREDAMEVHRPRGH